MKLDNNIMLFKELVSLIEDGKRQLSFAANATITITYWRVGKRINDDVLKNKRAGYGKQIVETISQQLTEQYGNNYGVKNLRRMMQFAQIFNDEQIVVPLVRQLSWTHFLLLIPLKNPLKRDFYAQMCGIESWNKRTLKQKIDGMLFERTVISKKPEALIKKELLKLKETNQLTPDLIFKDPYFLDFTGLKDTYSEESLEDAILREMEQFILELGTGFTFIERQKRMIIDGEDFHLDLLFFHRKLKRLIAIDLKLGKFKAAYKGQMELYLRWLEENDRQKGEGSPLGLILCAEGSPEQIALLQLEKAGIKVAEYLTELPDRELLKQKLHKAIEIAKAYKENKE